MMRQTIIGLALLVVSLVVGCVAGALAVAREDELGGLVIGFFAVMGVLSGGMLMRGGAQT
jgi:hypothetical protein